MTDRWGKISNIEQERRFQARLQDPMRRWKLSANGYGIDHSVGGLLASERRDVWYTYIAEAPWYVVESEDKRRAYQYDRAPAVHRFLLRPPASSAAATPRPPSHGYQRPPREAQTYVPDHTVTLA
jgi:polyphosphate kinase